MSKDASEPVVFAIISSAPAAEIMLQTLCAEVASESGVALEPRVLRTYTDLGDQMKRGTVHVAWAPPLIAIEIERSSAASVVLISSRAGRTTFQSAIFTKKTSPVKSVADLAGKRIAWVDEESSAGYVVPRLKLRASGFDLTSFGEEVFRRTHQAVSHAVLAGEVDAGATYVSRGADDEVVSAGWTEAGAKLDDVRILETAGPIPSDAIAMSRALDADKREALTKALLALGERAPEMVKGLLNADGFELAQQAHFDDLREMVEQAEKSGA
jgi:phosphonate transport system substrate-binding protein